MKAMILAAGRGERLRPITDTIPKPLVEVGQIPLLVHHINKLKKAGITDILVNSAYLSEKIVSYLNDGSSFGVKITHSVEGEQGLETAGGIINALSFFEGEDFLVVNGDTFIDADYSQFLVSLKEDTSAHLFLTENPKHNLKGDFDLFENGECTRGSMYTFSGAARYQSSAFKGYDVCRLKLSVIFEKWSQEHKMTGQLLNGRWFDVGTIERLEEVNNYYKENCHV
ncbi:MAG: nucleotidyltransferase family protein [Succinivibrio sp.]|nr:nucleotidyltransferase family protein [Succinivibrio sp.]